MLSPSPVWLLWHHPLVLLKMRAHWDRQWLLQSLTALFLFIHLLDFILTLVLSINSTGQNFPFLGFHNDIVLQFSTFSSHMVRVRSLAQCLVRSKSSVNVICHKYHKSSFTHSMNILVLGRLSSWLSVYGSENPYPHEAFILGRRRCKTDINK